MIEASPSPTTRTADANADPSLARLLDAFPALASLDAPARRRLTEGASPARVPAGTVLFRDGAACEAYTLVLEGCVRVQKVSPGGRQIVLYRVEPGQTCVLTTNALLAALPHGAEGIAETDVAALQVPGSTFQDLLAVSAAFRRFVFSAYAMRVADLLSLIDAVAFGRIDARLARRLLTRADNGGIVVATHMDLATELGTAREVISRQLKEFERAGWVDAARGRVRVVDSDALRRIMMRDDETPAG